MNELLLIGSVVLIFGTVILAYKLLGKAGLFCGKNLTDTGLVPLSV